MSAALETEENNVNVTCTKSGKSEFWRLQFAGGCCGVRRRGWYSPILPKSDWPWWPR